MNSTHVLLVRSAVLTLVCLALIPNVEGAAQGDAIVRIVPSESKIWRGQTTTVDVQVEQISGLYGIELHLRFDPTVLQVVDAFPDAEGVQVEPGAFPKPDFVVQNKVDNTAGTIDYAATQIPPTLPAEGAGTALRVTLVARRAQETTIEFRQFLLADNAGRNIPAVEQSALIQVRDYTPWVSAAVVGAAALIAGGIGFAYSQRKRE